MSNPFCVAIIPVRGGSRGIPRKNARLLAGRPLLAHALETAKKARRVDHVYVSTDDAELAEIAARWGVDVLPRPPELARDDVGLDAVIVDAVRRIEAGGIMPEQVVTIQATCPLLTAETVDAACDKLTAEGLDTVLSVVRDTHLAWGLDAGGQLAPLYAERLNRQQLPPRFRETGGAVVCDRRVLDSGTRFGPRCGVVELTKSEAIDIDDHFDWWLVEKSLERRTICFHVIGNSEVGLGHVYRALTLADRLIDHNLWFLTNESSGLAAMMIRNRHYTARVVPAGGEVQAILESKPDLVVNDILDTDELYIRPLKDAGIAVMNFEDLGPGSQLADCLVNAMYDERPARQDQWAMHGAQCCCLRDEFYSIQPRIPNESVNNILLAFGGVDPGDLTRKCLEWLDELDGNWEITAILGIGHPSPESVQECARNARRRVNVVRDTAVISRFMAQADLAVTSAGRTVFELACLGVPLAVVAQNERESRHGFACNSPGVAYLGPAERLQKEAFQSTMRALIEDPGRRLSMRGHLLSANLRGGIVRVLDAMESLLKRYPAKEASACRSTQSAG